MLTPAQQAKLNDCLRETNLLTNEELIQELTDHFTDATNARMAHGVTFETALTDVQRAFGGRKRLQKMERHYNRVTFRRYDTLWMQYIQKQSRWPHCLLPLFMFGIIYWTTTHTSRPAAFSVDTLVHNPWFGFALGSILGLAIKFVQLVVKGGITGKNFPHKALYLLSRIIPITMVLYGFCALLTYLNTYFPPFVYEAILSVCAALIVTYMISYSQFHQAILKNKPKAG